MRAALRTVVSPEPPIISAMDLFRAVFRVGNKGCPILEFVPVTPFTHKCLVKQAFGDDDMGKRRQNRDVGARTQRDMGDGLDMRRTHKVNPARIDDDQFRPLTQAFFKARGKDRMAIGRVCADQDDNIGMFDRIKILRPGRGTKRGLEAITSR